MKYTQSIFPDLQAYREMSLDEAKKHFDRFIEQVPVRCEMILELTKPPVLPCPWDDVSIKKGLDYMSKWLMRSCDTRELTAAEIEREATQFREPIRSSVRDMLRARPWILTPISDSYCTDCGILYLELHRASHPKTFWSYEKQKTNANRHVPRMGIDPSTGSWPFAVAPAVLKALKQGGKPVDLYEMYTRIGKPV